jgi:hypothetical protein
MMISRLQTETDGCRRCRSALHGEHGQGALHEPGRVAVRHIRVRPDLPADRRRDLRLWGMRQARRQSRCAMPVHWNEVVATCAAAAGEPAMSSLTPANMARARSGPGIVSPTRGAGLRADETQFCASDRATNPLRHG